MSEQKRQRQKYQLSNNHNQDVILHTNMESVPALIQCCLADTPKLKLVKIMQQQLYSAIQQKDMRANNNFWKISNLNKKQYYELVDNDQIVAEGSIYLLLTEAHRIMFNKNDYHKKLFKQFLDLNVNRELGQNFMYQSKFKDVTLIMKAYSNDDETCKLRVFRYFRQQLPNRKIVVTITESQELIFFKQILKCKMLLEQHVACRVINLSRLLEMCRKPLNCIGEKQRNNLFLAIMSYLEAVHIKCSSRLKYLHKSIINITNTLLTAPLMIREPSSLLIQQIVGDCTYYCWSTTKDWISDQSPTSRMQTPTLIQSVSIGTKYTSILLSRRLQLPNVYHNIILRDSDEDSDQIIILKQILRLFSRCYDTNRSVINLKEFDLQVLERIFGDAKSNILVLNALNMVVNAINIEGGQDIVEATYTQDKIDVDTIEMGDILMSNKQIEHV